MRIPLNSAKKAFTRVLAILGFSQAEERDVDVEQAFLRVLVTVIVLAYGTATGVADQSFSLELMIALACGVVTGSAGLWMLYRFHRNPARPASMRSFGIAADLIPITVGLFWAGEIGVPLVGLYLWITVGNGFRFGPRYLLQSYALTGICFTLLLLFSPFWQQHRQIGIGLAVLLATIPLYVLVLLSRLTAQKNAAEQLSNAKSRFVANVSHELRTPLTGVVAVHDLLLRRPLSAADRDLVDTLGNAIRALKSSVDAILQMSKLEAGAERVDLQPFNLRSYLNQFNVQIAPAAEAKNLTWRVTIADDVPGTIIGDTTHLTHVIGNLVNNALKFTTSGSVVLQVSTKGQRIHFDVTDTGVGIPTEKQAHIFERFVQADASATRRFGGTGLGTSIAHDLVKLMGGQIGLSSREGAGSTFWFELPIRTETPDALMPPSSDDNRAICVISENLAESNRIASYLREQGFSCALALPDSMSNIDLSQISTRAAILVMQPDRARNLAESYLHADNSCPWLLVATTAPTRFDLQLLWNASASDILPLSTSVQLIHAAVVGLLPAPASQPSLKTISHAPRRILIADDNESNLLLITRILEESGHSVRAVDRGDAAYDLMMSGQFDIALLDYNMPEMTGPDAVKLFRAGEVGGQDRLPILVVSADATPDAQRDSLQAGADGHLVKPVQSSELLDIVAKLTAGRPVRTERRAVKREYPKLVASHVPANTGLKIASGATVERVLLDPVRFGELQRIANNDIAFMRRYATASFSDIECALTELRSAISNGDKPAISDALHKIDGTSKNLGAFAITQASARMKQKAGDPRSLAATEAAADIATICALTKSAMTAALEQAFNASIAKLP